MASFVILTLGCRANQADSERICAILSENGFTQVPAGQPADLGIVNSCTVTSEADRKVCQMIRRLSTVCGRVAVTGCGAAANGGLAGRIPPETIIVPPSDRENIMRYLAPVQIDLKSTGTEGEGGASIHHRARALLKVQEGCSHMCTFCIVPMVRGPLKSFGVEDLLPQVSDLAQKGYREIVLTGTHLALWGRDPRIRRLDREAGNGHRDFADLLEGLIKGSSGVRFRISSIEPMSFPERILDLMLQYPDRLCPHLHLVIQHASDKILKAMHRDYTLAEYDSLAQKFLSRVPGACLTTDVLVGFPGETEDDLAILEDYISRVPFYHLHVFPYSKRPGTAAASYPDQVPDGVKHERVRRIIALGNKRAEEVFASFAGTVRPVLAEKVSGRPGFLTGTADNFLSVEFPGGPADIGKIVSAEIRKYPHS